jgi:DHA2 family multidrug resistance protein-like MFS transporter
LVSAAAYAASAEMLIAARALLGLAGATLLPSTLAIISNLFPDRAQRGVAIGVWATCFTIGGVIGPLCWAVSSSSISGGDRFF